MSTSTSRHPSPSFHVAPNEPAASKPATRPGVEDGIAFRDRWFWRSEHYSDFVPADFDEAVWSIASTDRFHAKQGRSTARVTLTGISGTIQVYLKRHLTIGVIDGLLARLDPRGAHTPGKAEWKHLEHARALGIRVPDAVAAGEQYGPALTVRSYLAVAELTGQTPLHEALPTLKARLAPLDFARVKRALVGELAAIAARLHRNRCFHQDLYLCHFFIDVDSEISRSVAPTLIDWHRMVERRVFPHYKRAKDLAQLLYSTHGVDGVDDRDRIRFWVAYTRALGGKRRPLTLWLARRKARRLFRHNRVA